MEPTGFIPNDGYTQNGYIQPVHNLYSALHFKYRPMRYEDRQRMMLDLQTLQPHKVALEVARVLAKKLVSWDQVDDQDAVVKITAENLLSLNSRKFDRLFDIITGQAPGDDDPDAVTPIKERLRTLADELEAEEKGVSLAAVTEVNDAKN